MDKKPTPWHQVSLPATGDQFTASYYALVTALIRRWPKEFNTAVMLKIKSANDDRQFIHCLIEIPPALIPSITESWRRLRQKEKQEPVAEKRECGALRSLSRILNRIANHLATQEKSNP